MKKINRNTIVPNKSFIQIFRIFIFLISILSCGTIYSQSVEASVNHICKEGDLGSIILTFEPGFEEDYPFPYEAEWENTENGEYEEFRITSLNHLINNLEAGTYEITIDLNDDCVIYLDIRIGEFYPIIRFVSATASECESNGTIFLQTNDQFRFKSVMVHYENMDDGTTGSTEQSIPYISMENLPSGPYEVTVELPNGCSETVSVTIPHYEPMNILTNVTPVDCINRVPGSIQLSITGGLEPYSIIWYRTGHTVFQDQTYIEWPDGNVDFVVEVIDANGCELRKSVFLPVEGEFSNEVINDVSIVVLQRPCKEESNGSIAISIPDLTDYNVKDFYSVSSYGSVEPFYENFSSPDPEDIVLNNLKAGDYIIKFLQDDNLCPIIKHFTITEENRLKIVSIDIVPACDGNGSIDFNVSGLKENEQLSYSWSDGSNGSSLSDLSAGTYWVTITSDQSECELVQSFDIPDNMEEYIEFVVAPACHEPYGGMVIVAIGREIHDDFIYEWSGDFDMFSENWIYNLEAGEYCVTVSGVNSGCIVEKCLTVEENPEVIVPEAQVFPTCEGQNSGYILFTYPNGEDEDFTKSNLSQGEHCFDFENMCNSTTVCYDVPVNSIYVELAYQGECNDDKHIVNNVTGGSPPYHYIWNTGASTANLNEFWTDPTGDYVVTVTDSEGCSKVASIDNQLSYLDYYYEVISQPCLGSSNGEIQVHWGENNNNSNIPDDLTIQFNGNVLGVLNEDTPSITVSNIFGEIENELVFTAGDCVYSESITLDALPLSNVFSHTEMQSNNQVCVFDQFCEDELIVENGMITNTGHDFLNATNGIWSNCKLPLLCGDVQVGVERVSMRKVSIVEYNMILALMAPFMPGILPSPQTGHPCTKVRYCPATMDVVATYNGGAFQPEHSWSQGNCHKIACKWPTSDEHFCIELPFNLPETENSNCSPRIINVLQLYRWKDQMASFYGNTFTNSTLFDFLNNLFDHNIPEMTCSKVSFCMNNFEFISSDFSTTLCDNTDYTLYDYSSPYYVGGNQTICHEIVDNDFTCGECPTNVHYYCEDINGVINSFTIEDVFNPVFLELGIVNRSIKIKEEIIARNQLESCYELIRFGSLVNDGCWLPKGLYECNGDFIYEDFVPNSIALRGRQTDNVTHLVENWDRQRNLICAQKDSSSFKIMIANDTISYTSLLASTELLSIDYINNNSDNIYLIGSFTGSLSYDGISIGGTMYENTFILEIEEDGSLVKSFILNDLDYCNNKSYGDDISDNLLFVTSSDNSHVNDLVLNRGKGELLDLSTIIINNEKRVDRIIMIPDQAEVILGKKIDDSFICLVNGSGKIKWENEYYNLDSQYSIIELRQESLEIIPLNLEGVKRIKADIGLDGMLNLLLSSTSGVTYNGLKIHDDKGVFVNLLVKYDINNKSASPKYKVISEGYDVAISDFGQSCGLYYFGGSYMSENMGVVIGNKKFVEGNAQEGQQKPFISFTTDSNFIDVSELNNGSESYTRSFSHSLFDISPNPFTNSISISSLNEGKISKCSILDLNGRVVFNVNDINDNYFVITGLDISSGMYLLTVVDEYGNKYTEKIVSL